MLKTRVITAVVLLAGLLGAIFLLPAIGWLALCALVCAAAGWEWGALTRMATPVRVTFAALLGAACLLIGLYAGLARPDGAPGAVLLPVYLLSALFWLAVVPFWLRHKWPVPGLASAILVGLVVLLPPALALAHLRQFGAWLLLAAMAICWIADIAAYFTGRAFGRRKLAPAISPGKSWEGVYGALLGVVVYGLLVNGLAQGPFSGAAGLLALSAALIVLTAVSVMGDLFESLLKRQVGLKDSGSLLPGHGGILDRIDSITSTLPLIGLAALWFAR
ncbi:phosphatidate cytidylyltransferase [Pseudothauera nasutitermitis]|uniref:Phosphatidate cytidylyltransferase n=1 Tax=Pseudothauera nasutitermitis TaxID=2565930 RepID=A0A4S4B3A6_9RHOO|nr:phosphatidate cytidylyltransferase [Pseudothauera nasutitermitis]THF66220.1 phosphatidate cytidylyltransferase [Pseudothauera nasutitermitis]